MANEFSRLNGWLRRQFGFAGNDPSPWLDLTTYTGSFPPGVGAPTAVAGVEPLTNADLIAASLTDSPGQAILFDGEIYHQTAAGQNVASNWEKGTADLASEVVFAPTATIAATDVQAAVAEVDSEHVAKAATPVAGNLYSMDANGDGTDADVGVSVGDAMLNKAKAATDTFGNNDFGFVTDATYGAKLVYHDVATIREIPFTTAAQRRAVTSTAISYAVLLTDDVILGTSGAGGITATLPTAVGITGKTYDIVKVDAGAGALTVDGNGAETINGAATYSLPNQWDTVTVISDGTNWIVL